MVGNLSKRQVMKPTLRKNAAHEKRFKLTFRKLNRTVLIMLMDFDRKFVKRKTHGTANGSIKSLLQVSWWTEIWTRYWDIEHEIQMD